MSSVRNRIRLHVLSISTNIKMEADGEHKNKSIGSGKFVVGYLFSAGLFDYYHVPSMKKLFSI